MKKKTKKGTTSHQLPVRFDAESEEALKRLLTRLGESNHSKVIRWAVLQYDRDVRYGVDNKGCPLPAPPPTQELVPASPHRGYASHA